MQTIKFPISEATVRKMFQPTMEQTHRHTVKFSMWDGEVTADVIVATCVYGMPSVVIVYDSIGNGVTAEQWNSYDKDFPDGFTQFFALYTCIAASLNTRATGTQLATGTTSDFIIE